MSRRQQAIALALLLALTVLLFAGLAAWAPRVAGQTLRSAELSVAMSELLPNEREPLFAWLAVDCVFALVYTVFFTWGLRWLAAALVKTHPRLDLIGRSLSWVTGLAIVFDLAENAILWAAASSAAPRVSPWLSSLVQLKWVSLMVFLAYGSCWLVRRPRPPDSGAWSTP